MCSDTGPLCATIELMIIFFTLSLSVLVINIFLNVSIT